MREEQPGSSKGITKIVFITIVVVASEDLGGQLELSLACRFGQRKLLGFLGEQEPHGFQTFFVQFQTELWVKKGKCQRGQPLRILTCINPGTLLTDSWLEHFLSLACGMGIIHFLADHPPAQFVQLSLNAPIPDCFGHQIFRIFFTV